MRTKTENYIPWNFRLGYRLERIYFRPEPLNDVEIGSRTPMIHTFRLSKYYRRTLNFFGSSRMVFESSALIHKRVDENGWGYLADPVYLIVRHSENIRFENGRDDCTYIQTTAADYFSFKFQQSSWTRQLVEWARNAERPPLLSTDNEIDLDLYGDDSPSLMVNWRREGF